MPNPANMSEKLLPWTGYQMRHSSREDFLGRCNVDIGRRIVTVRLESGEDKELVHQTKNIFRGVQTIHQEIHNVVDASDRLDTVTLQEVIVQGRPETSKVLCHEHNANVDVADAAGIMRRSMSLQVTRGMEHEAMRIVKRPACKKAVSDNACGS